jgi:hypothetical protein
LHALSGLALLLTLFASDTAPGIAWGGAASSRLDSSQFANRSDPFVGPLTREAARHSQDALNLSPATGTVIPRQTSSTGTHGAFSSASMGFNHAGLQKEVMGFAPYWSLSQENGWDYNVLSTINYFGLTLAFDGSWITNGGGYTGFSSQNLVDMINRAHAAGDRVLLSVEASGQAPLNDVVTYPPSTTAALANIMTALGAKAFDGVNIDFEGYTSSTYPNIQTGLTNFMSALSSQVKTRWPQDMVAIDTYSGAASWDFGLMKIDALAPYVDAMFIMAYDMSFSNMGGRAGPNAPLNGWTYNDTLSVTQYLTKAPASKIVLGIPWYGYKFTTLDNTPYSPSPGSVADTYAQARSDSACAHPAYYWDSTAQSVWAVWYSRRSGDPCGANLGKWQELYYDDVRSLGVKYDLVNSSGIRGMGIWALGYDGGAPELWGELNTYFSCPVSITPPTTVTTSEFSVALSAGSCSVSAFDVQQYDSTLSQGWFTLKPSAISAGSATVTVEGFPGSTYALRARAHSAAGVVSSWTNISVTVDPAATWSHPFKSLYTVDDFGGIHGADSPPLQTIAYWPGWKIVRAAKAIPGNPQSGLLLDGYGGLHYFGAPTTIASTASWPGWDIARDFALLPDGSGGYVLDGYGGLHPFALGGHAPPPTITGGPYWPRWDVARKVVIFSDGTGGLVMDAYGGLHPFGIGGPAPAAPTGGPYWAGYAIARDVVLVPGTHAGYVLDGIGGIHAFSGAAAVQTPAYWPGWDIARSLWLLSSSTLTAPAGYLLDGYGGVHPFGGAPALVSAGYWGQDLAHNLAGN